MKKVIFMLAATIISSTLQAQERTESLELEEVTVTATKFSKKLIETGKVVNIITAEELRRQGGKDLAEILNEQPGLIVNGATSNYGKDKAVYLRGANYGYTLILLNGVPVTDPSGVGGAFDLRMLPVEQIERIEIVKGAQSTLYGSDAVAGVINIITKNSGNKPASFYGGLTYGSHNTLKANAGVVGAIKGSSYNVGYVHNESKGISEAKDTLDKGIRNGMLSNAVNVDLKGKIAENLYIKPFFRYAYFKGTYPNGAFAPAKNDYHSSLINTGSQAEYNFNGGSLNGLFTFDKVKRSYPFDSYEGTKNTAELFSNYNISKNVQALAGFRFDKLNMVKPNPDTKDTSITIASPYVSVFLKELSGFFMEAGVRYNKHSKYGSNTTFSLNPSYVINHKMKLFLNYGSSFRAPALTELYGQWGANPDLKPEKSTTLEVGAEWRTPDDFFKGRVVWFDRKIKDVIIYGPKFSYLNFNSQNDHGFEAEAQFKLNPSIAIKLFYAYVDGKVTTNTGAKDTTYNNLLRRPKNSFGANLGYNISPQLFVSTNIHYNSSRNDLYFDPVTFASSTIELKPYTLWDVYAEYGIWKNKIKLFAQCNNLLNVDYYEVYGYTTFGRNYNLGFRFSL